MLRVRPGRLVHLSVFHYVHCCRQHVQMLSVYVRSYILVERLFWHMRSQSELILLIVADLYIYVSENKQNKLAYATQG